MISPLVLVLLFASTLSTSLIFFPMKPAAPQDFDIGFKQDQDNDCLEGFFFCSNSAGIVISTLGNPIEGSSRIDQSQLNECVGSFEDQTLCFNIANAELFLSSSDQAFIESNSKQLSEQTNKCIAGALCVNTGEFIDIDPFQKNEFISIVAEDQATVKADTEQNTFQDNTCEGVFTECFNSGVDLIGIVASDEAIVEADSKQLLKQGDECIDAFCNNAFGENFFTVTALDWASVDSKAAQNSEQGNECSNASCNNSFGANFFNVFSSGQGIIEGTGKQSVEQGNECNNAVCANAFGENFFSMSASDQGSIDAKVYSGFRAEK